MKQFVSNVTEEEKELIPSLNLILEKQNESEEASRLLKKIYEVCAKEPALL
ncbi:hypothetical protein [Cytobacillus sp. IB215665]|uniref:hypothetical protein n=1 Tax=Cytobacillus sp. IB215665 TaxID=3097357 RepID=UPI002A183E7D|nr:hypothetical protein [Cytobacillus sp. IB215665]MDX8367169.1 hypothetical protein [Cytobacillus sp. IB215665]